MQSLGDEELRAKVSKSLRVFNFFIFSRTIYPDVINLLKSANIVRLIRIYEIDGDRNYYLLEPDVSVCNHSCSSKCHSENNLKGRCYVECFNICRSSVIDTILSNLSHYL